MEKRFNEWFGGHFRFGYPKIPVRTAVREGLLPMAVALVLNFFAARTTKARLCCALLAYFGLGILVTGVAGL